MDPRGAPRSLPTKRTMLEFLAHTQTHNWDHGGSKILATRTVLGTKTRPQFWVPKRVPSFGFPIKILIGAPHWDLFLVPKNGAAFWYPKLGTRFVSDPKLDSVFRLQCGPHSGTPNIGWPTQPKEIMCFMTLGFTRANTSRTDGSESRSRRLQI